MKNLLIITLLLCSFSSMAQEEDPLEKAPPRLIVQTGLGLQWFGEIYKSSSLSIEKPFGHFWHLGIQGNLFFQKSSEDFFATEFNDGFEIGGYAKHFLHGRLSGRKSGLYIGPDFRFGARNFQVLQTDFFPLPLIPTYYYYKESTTKILMRWGIQWQFGHANLDISAPFGIELFKTSVKVNGNYQGTQFVLLPTLQLGYAF
jgi:hypothetical protein